MRDLKFKLGQNQCDFALVLHSGCRSWKRTCSHIKSLSVLALQDHRSRMPVYDYRQRVRLLKLEDVSWTGFTNMLAVTWTRHVPWSHSSTRFFNTSIIIDWMPLPSLNTCRHRHHRHHPPTQTTYQVQFKIEQRWEAKLKVPKKLRLPPQHKHTQTNLSQVLRLLRNPARQQHTKAQNTVAQTLSNVTQNHAPSAIHNIRTPIVRATRVAFKPSSCHLRFSNPSGVVRS